MKKKTSLFHFLSFIGIITCLLPACNKPLNKVFDSFNNNSKERNLIIIISDIHLGADLSYSETNINLGILTDFLEQIRRSSSVKELVIAGDLIDEWFIPASINPYNGKNQTDFAERVAQTNKGVFDKLNQIIQEKKILVTYIPGNHDLTITKENIDSILPGINQARDANALGLGTYSPSGFPEIAIEHGHRYHFMCAPDPISNQNIAPGTILPAGYFFARIAAEHFKQGCLQNADAIPIITTNTSGGGSQSLLYSYWSSWAWWLTTFPIQNHFYEKIIISDMNGFNDTCSVNDLMPTQANPGGFIKLKLFDGFQDSWTQRCERNNVVVSVPAREAFAYASSANGIDTMAVIQYFNNPYSSKRIVVFGHTHVATIKDYKNYKGQKSIYANSGTWIDDNPNGPTMDFLIITPKSIDNSQTFVTLFSFKDEVIKELAKDSISF
ncbi:MAG: metallophosphoesterase [Bacteroidales bacterium]|nr:metallophosphoesterase [Bacteroidales bacterium]